MNVETPTLGQRVRARCGESDPVTGVVAEITNGRRCVIDTGERRVAVDARYWSFEVIDPPLRECRCDGRYDGCDHPYPCSASAGSTHSPFFCQPCDDRRRAHITANLESIGAGMGDGQ